MGLSKFVSLFAESVLPDCNQLHHHQHHHHQQQQQQRQHRHQHRRNDSSTVAPRTGNIGGGGGGGESIILPPATYNSELDIYGTTARFKKSLLWGSLRRVCKSKGTGTAGHCQTNSIKQPFVAGFQKTFDASDFIVFIRPHIVADRPLRAHFSATTNDV